MHLMYSYFIFHFQDIRLVSRNGQIGWKLKYVAKSWSPIHNAHLGKIQSYC
jgi:hypothetical protein